MRQLSFSVVSLIALTAAISTTAHGQTASVDDERANGAVISNDAIVVTARRRAEDIQKVPIAITAFSGETLERKSVLSTADLTKVTPGLNITGAGSLVNPFVTIRGQSKGLAGPGTPGVLSYFNEVPLPTYGSLISTYDMDNVQVLKGPQGTLFGRNAIGGAVLTYSKKPTYDFGGYMQVEYGRFNSLRVEGAINLPVVQDKLAVRLAAQMNGTDGFTRTDVYSPFTLVPDATSLLGVRAVPGQKLDNQRSYDQYDTRAVRASILFEPVETIHNTTVFDYSRLRGTNNTIFTGMNPLNPTPVYRVPVNFLPAAIRPLIGPLFQCGTSPSCDINLAIAQAAKGNLRSAQTDEPADATSTLVGISNTTVIDLGESTSLKNIFGYRTIKTVQGADIDGTAMPLANTANLVNLKQLTNELQISGSLFNNKLKYVAGGFYYKSSPNGPGGFQALHITAFGGLQDTQTVNYLTEESKALYGQFDYEIISNLTATAGYRYTWDKASGCAYSADYSITNGGRLPTPGKQAPFPDEQQCKTNNFTPDPNASRGSVIAQNFEQKSRKGTYTFALNYQIAPNALVYATTRRGYRSAGFNVPTLNPVVADLQTYRPETLTDYELGAKGRYNLGSARGTFSAAYFWSKDKDYQYYQNTSGIAGLPSSGLLINKADLKISGFEGEMTISPIQGLTLGGNVAYTKVSVAGVKLPASLVQAYTNAGVSTAALQVIAVPNQPKWQYNLNADWQIAQVAGGDLQFNADFHKQTKYRSGEIDVPGWKTLDVRLTLANLYNGAVDVSVYGRNILNEKYFAGTSSSSTGLGAISYILAPPVTYGATLRYRFGS